MDAEISVSRQRLTESFFSPSVVVLKLGVGATPPPAGEEEITEKNRPEISKTRTHFCYS